MRDLGMSRWVTLCMTGGVAVEIPEFFGLRTAMALPKTMVGSAQRKPSTET